MVIEYKNFNPKIYKRKFNKLFDEQDNKEIIKILKTENIFIANYAYVLSYISANKRGDCEDIIIFCATQKEPKVKKYLLGFPNIFEPYNIKFKKEVYEILKNDNDPDVRERAVAYFERFGL